MQIGNLAELQSVGGLMRYGVATISRMLKNIGLFCKELYKRDLYSAKRPVFWSILLIVATPYSLHHEALHFTHTQRIYIQIGNH